MGWREALGAVNDDRRRRVMIVLGLMLCIGAPVLALTVFSGARKPPSIFDTPIDGVADYLVSEDFSRLSVQERLDFLRDLYERFKGLEQSESAALAGFLAGLSGPAKEQARDNARILAKDILVEGAQGYLALESKADRGKYIDDWLVKWVRFGEEITGEDTPRSEQDILERLRRDAKRDAERGFQLDREVAQFMIDMWETDVAPVASPAEQGAIFTFLPALRDHLLGSGK
jgi:hypothetical protein